MEQTKKWCEDCGSQVVCPAQAQANEYCPCDGDIYFDEDPTMVVAYNPQFLNSMKEQA